jgi:UDP-N-acetylglucosamine--N-acetylmuramyl-(pentapeptide) pyrophosphoryl-undecaprenol N-acetylglucosamine transferase
MANAYAISKLVISRSGALTVSEITSCGLPAILIPFLNAAGDHQTKNAEALVDAGAAEILNEKNINHNTLFHSIMNLIHNKQKLKKMKMASKKIAYPYATRAIVDDIFSKAVDK